MQVRISGFQKEVDGFSGATDKIFNKIEPALSVIESGKVTFTGSKFIVFEHRVVFFIDSNAPILRFKQQCEYEKIATNHRVDGKDFKWRVVEVRHVNDIEKVERLVEMPGISLRIARSDKNSFDGRVQIDNRSNTLCFVKNIRIDSTSRMIGLKKRYENREYRLYGKKSFVVHYIFFPRQAGQFMFKFLVDFETTENEKFSKACFVEIDVYNEMRIHVREPSSAPRFQEIKMKDYWIPLDLRTINVINCNVGIDKLGEYYPVCFEDLCERNYLEKVHIGIYLEEVALEIAFKAFHIEKDRFSLVENNGKESLKLQVKDVAEKHQPITMKLQVKDVAEKRPSITFGDRIKATKLVDGKAPTDLQTQMTIDGWITKVCEDSVLVKFPERAHKDLLDYEYSIDFEFSRKLFRQQHHAIDTVCSNSGLGLDFIFPDGDKMKANPRHKQIDVKLQHGKLTSFGKQLNWFDSRLNAHQKEAVVNVLRGECRQVPYIIYGPPGESSFHCIDL